MMKITIKWFLTIRKKHYIFEPENSRMTRKKGGEFIFMKTVNTYIHKIELTTVDW